MPELTEEQHALLKTLRKQYYAEMTGEGVMQRPYQNWLEERYLELHAALRDLSTDAACHHSVGFAVIRK